MDKKILDLINSDNWTQAIDILDDMFMPIYNQKTLFHYACMRGNKKIIEKYLDTHSDKIYLSDSDGNTGCHLLAYGEWDNILIDVVKKYPMFLKLKNTNDEFVHDFVLNRPQTLKLIVKIMKSNKLFEYFNYVKNDDRTFILDIIDKSHNNLEYMNILKIILSKSNIQFNTTNTINLTNQIDLSNPKNSPPLIYSIVKKYDDVNYYLLDELKCDVNVLTINQISPLHVAILANNEKLINSILKLNPDINFAGFENRNVPLSLCWKYGLIDSAENILKFDKLNFDKKDHMLNTPIYYLIYLIIKKRHVFTNKQYIQCKNQLKFTITKSNLQNLNINNESPLNLLKKYKLLELFDVTETNKSENISKNKNDKLINSTNLTNSTNSEFSSKKSELSDTELSDYVNSQSSYISNFKLIKLPKIANDDGEFGLFNADGIHNVLYIFVMLSKYKNLTIPTQTHVYDKQRWDIYKKLTHCVITNDNTDTMHHLVSIYYKIFYRVAPAIIIWKDKNMWFKSNDTIYLEKNIMIPVHQIRFILMRITIITDEPTLHANIVIYDKLLNKLIRFEPYGDWEFSDSYNLDQLIINTFMTCLKSICPDKQKTLKYIRPRDYLDRTKFQTTSLGDNNTEKNLGDPAGYCLAWCFWFLELKLANPDDDENELVNSAFNEITINNKDKTNSNPLLTHIRSYAKQLDKEKNYLLEKIGIQKVNMYKMVYDNQNINLIKNFVEKYKF